MRTFYISPKGSDNNCGSAYAPFRTVAHALSIAKDNAEVILLDGCYQEEKTWKITGSGINIRAAHGTRPVISGGVEVKGWRLVETSDIPGLMCADLPDGVSYARNFYIDGRRAERVRSEGVANSAWDLLDDPDMQFYRKIEDADTIQGIKAVYEGYLSTNTDMLKWRNKSDIEFVYDVGWTHCVVPVDSITPVDDKAFVKMRMPVFRECLIKGGVQIGSPSYIENAYELLGTPGQWYIDRNEGMIYYLPLENEDMDKLVCILPVLEKFIDITGQSNQPVADICISGLTFAYSSWLKPSTYGIAEVQGNIVVDANAVVAYGIKPEAAVSLTWCNNVSFEACLFTKIGANALDMDTGVSHTRINACKFEDISGSGIQIGRFDEKGAHPDDECEIVHDITVSNCYLVNIGAEFRGSLGIIAGYVQNVDIINNEIAHTSYSGISLGWGWGKFEPDRDTTFRGVFPSSVNSYHRPTVCMRNRIMFNHIHNVMEKLHDGAGIYTLGLQNGSVLRGNYIHDNAFSDLLGVRHEEEWLVQTALEPTKSFKQVNGEVILLKEGELGTLTSRAGFPGGVYLDEASGGFYVTENIVHSVSIPFFIHDTGTTNRRTTNFIYDNCFNIYPDNPDFPKSVVQKAGISPAYQTVKDYKLSK